MLQKEEVLFDFECKLNLTKNYIQLLKYIRNKNKNCRKEYNNVENNPYNTFHDGHGTTYLPRFLVMFRYNRLIKSDLKKLMHLIKIHILQERNKCF